MENEFDLFEAYDDNLVLEICEECLRIRVFSETWLKPDEIILSFYLSMKKYHTLTLCPFCLFELYDGKIKI